MTELLKVSKIDSLVVALANRHYARRHPSHQVGSPARSLVLRDATGTVAFVWTYPRDGYRKDGQNGANCELFRKESPGVASELILAAEALVVAVWPEVPRFFTYVDPRRVASPNPGYCFLCAGYSRGGIGPSGKLLLFKERPSHRAVSA